MLKWVDEIWAKNQVTSTILFVLKLMKHLSFGLLYAFTGAVRRRFYLRRIYLCRL